VLQITFTVDFMADERLQSPQTIRNETRDRLKSLGAALQSLNIPRARFMHIRV
jgi:hypothetical protein